MIFGLDALTLLAIGVAALLTGILHGATGMAGGIVMAAILAHLVGIKTAVPVMTVALVFSHLSRAVMYARDTDWAIAGRVLLFGCPTIIVGALVFGWISPAAIAVVFATFHPSYLLRLPEGMGRRKDEFDRWVSDLKMAVASL